jgi:hypothetical protein
MTGRSPMNSMVQAAIRSDLPAADIVDAHAAIPAIAASKITLGMMSSLSHKKNDHSSVAAEEEP